MTHAVYLSNWSPALLILAIAGFIIAAIWTSCSIRIIPAEHEEYIPRGNWLTRFAREERKKNSVKVALRLSVPSFSAMAATVAIPTFLFGKMLISEHWYGIYQIWINAFRGASWAAESGKPLAVITVAIVICLYGFMVMGAVSMAAEFTVSRRLGEYARKGMVPEQIVARGGALYALLQVLRIAEAIAKRISKKASKRQAA